MDYLVHGTGLLATTTVHVHVIGRTAPSVVAPDLQLQFQPFAVERAAGDGGIVRRAKEDGFQPASALVRPRARGHVELRGKSPALTPVIDHRFLESSEDLRDVIAGARELRRVMEQPALRGIVGDQYGPEKDCRSDEDWAAYARAFVRGVSHPVGSCKMGTDELAVVDPELRVRGVGGLARRRLRHAANTDREHDAPAMMIGERAVELMLGNGAGQPRLR